MSYGNTGFSDLSNNLFAGVLNEIAEGMKGWSHFLLFVFLIYRIITNNAASLISLKSLMVAIGGSIIFFIAARIVADLITLLASVTVAPLIMKKKIQIAQNISYTIKAIIGFSLCPAAWFYARFVVDYAYRAI